MRRLGALLSETYTKHLTHVWSYEKTSGRDRMAGWRKHSSHASHEEAVKTAVGRQNSNKSTYAVGRFLHPTHYVDGHGLGKPIHDFKESLDEAAPFPLSPDRAERMRHFGLARNASNRANQSYQRSSEQHFMAAHHRARGDHELAAKYAAAGKAHHEAHKHELAISDHHHTNYRQHDRAEKVKPTVTKPRKEPK